MTNYFKLQEFYRPETYVPAEVIRKIQVHINTLNPIREELDCSITISKHSSYRPREYELAKGRSGKSQHCFVGKGAVDLTCKPNKLADLFLLLQNSDYTRVCMYPYQNFIHADMKELPEGEILRTYTCTDSKIWVRV